MEKTNIYTDEEHYWMTGGRSLDVLMKRYDVIII